MGDPNLKEIHDVLLGVAKKAGQMIVSANPSTVDTKKNCTLRERENFGSLRSIPCLDAGDLE